MGKLTKKDIKKLMNYLKESKELYNSFKEMPNFISEAIVCENIEKNEYIMEKNDELKNVVIVLEGEFRVINQIQTGKSYCFARGKSLDFLGLMEVLGDIRGCAATIQTLKRCRIIKIPKEIFIRWLREDIKLLFEVSKIVSRKFYESSTRNGEVFLNSNIYSFTNYILETSESEVKKEGYCKIKATKQEIADELGMSIRTVFRILEEYRKKDYLLVEDGEIIIDKKRYAELKSYLKKIN